MVKFSLYFFLSLGLGPLAQASDLPTELISPTQELPTASPAQELPSTSPQNESSFVPSDDDIVEAPRPAPKPSGEVSPGFKTECTKEEVFEGEVLACSFVILSSEDVIDVEVAKFPEFRGFWSENLALRQGPIPLLSNGFGADNIRKGVIGTYTLIPMIGKPEATIEPMKIVLRRPLSSIQAELVVSSEPAKLKIKPLPHPPTDFEPLYFSGAVGNFNIILETPEVSFRKGEPSLVRLSLQGEGNFAEINELKLAFPDNVEVLSRRSFSQGSGQFSMKTFEITFSANRNEDFTTAETPFYFFSPVTHRYQKLKIPPIRFTKVTLPIDSEKVTKEPIPFRDYQTKWVRYSALPHSRLFWLFHALFAMMTIGVVLKKWLEDFFSRQKRHPKFQRRLRMEIALNALEQGSLALFLKIADEIAYDILIEAAKLPAGLSRYQALVRAQGKLPGEMLSQIHEFFRAHEDFAYTEAKTPPLNTTQLAETLRAITNSSPKRWHFITPKKWTTNRKNLN